MKASMLAALVGLGVGASAVRAAASPGGDCTDALVGAKELETAGQLSAARARLSGCMADACAETARRECSTRIAGIDAAIPTVTVVVKDSEGRDVRDVRVTVDGKPLGDQSEGGSISVDPGEHHFLFQAAGFRPIETTAVAQAGQHKLRVMVFLNRDRAPSVVAANEPPLASPSAAVRPTPAWSPGNAETGVAPWQKKAAGALVGAAAGSLVLGTVWAFLAKAKYDHALTIECGGDPHTCSPQGIADGRTAHDRALIATVGFAGAATFLAGAAAVYFAWPAKHERITVAPSVNDKGAGLALIW